MHEESKPKIATASRRQLVKWGTSAVIYLILTGLLITSVLLVLQDPPSASIVTRQ